MAKKMSGRVGVALRKSLKYSLSQFLRQLLTDLDVRGAVNKPLANGRPGGLRKYLAFQAQAQSRMIENARLNRNLTKAELRLEILTELERRKAQTAKAREMLALKRKNLGLYLQAKNGAVVAVCPDTRHLMPPVKDEVVDPKPASLPATEGAAKPATDASATTPPAGGEAPETPVAHDAAGNAL